MIMNVGMQDRLIRLTLGIFFIFVGLNVTSISELWGWVIFALAVVAVLTGSITFCPLYKVVGLNTCKS